MANKFNVGDKVKLKIGGVKMLVERVNEDNTYHCIWVLKGETKRDNYSEEVLEKPEPLFDINKPFGGVVIILFQVI